MHDEERSGPIARGEWLTLAGIVAVFILLRVRLLIEPAVRLGWNSDAAIFGLMAKAIFAGRDFPIFFWGQSYMGPLTSLVAAACGMVLSLFGITPAVGPLALRLGAATEVLAAIVLYWIALRRTFDARIASVVALWLAIGPAYLFFFTIAPIGGEQMFVLSAIIFWYSVRTMLRRQRDWFVFGLLGGIGWWIHQGVVFAIGATLLIVILRSEAWATAWRAPQIVDRLLLRTSRLRWREDDRFLVLFLRLLNAILLLWIFNGVLFSAGAPVPPVFAFSPLLEPFVAFCAFRLALAISFGRDLREALALLFRDPRAWAIPLLLAVIGGVIGYAPVIVGGLLDRYPRGYGLSVPPMPFGGMIGHVGTAVRLDFWSFIGATGSPAAVVVAVVFLPMLLIAIVRHRRRIADLLTLRPDDYGARGIAAATMILCILFYVTSRRAYEGSVRYIVSALPMLYAFAAREMWTLRPRLLGTIGAIAIALGLGIPRIEQVRAVAMAHAENYANLSGDYDPRPTLRAIRAGGYSVCYATYWVAYKLQWLSDEQVKFIPFHSLDRTPAASHALEAAPGPKCLVDESGGVRPFSRRDFDESLMRAARERLQRMRDGSRGSP